MMTMQQLISLERLSIHFDYYLFTKVFNWMAGTDLIPTGAQIEEVYKPKRRIRWKNRKVSPCKKLHLIFAIYF